MLIMSLWQTYVLAPKSFPFFSFSFFLPDKIYSCHGSKCRSKLYLNPLNLMFNLSSVATAKDSVLMEKHFPSMSSKINSWQWKPNMCHCVSVVFDPSSSSPCLQSCRWSSYYTLNILPFIWARNWIFVLKQAGFRNRNLASVCQRSHYGCVHLYFNLSLSSRLLFWMTVERKWDIVLHKQNFKSFSVINQHQCHLGY